jgi:exodeoxyribonuclease VII small subunit
MSDTPNDRSHETAAPNFEQALTSLESIVHELEDGQIGLEQSLGRYEEGVKLLRYCHALLQTAERKIELLTRVDTAGQAVTEPFDDAPTAGDQAGSESPTRSRRRSAKSAKPAAENRGSSSEIDEPGSLF